LVYLVIALVLGLGILLLVAGQTVAAHHRLPPLRRRLQQNRLPVATLILGLGSRLLGL
jgi:hypothetical protein